MSAVAENNPIEALRRAIDYGCSSGAEHCKLPICTDARKALAEVDALVALLELGVEIAEGYEWQECQDAKQRDFARRGRKALVRFGKEGP